MKIIFEFDESGLLFPSIEVSTLIVTAWETREPGVAWLVNVILFFCMFVYINRIVRATRRYMMGRTQVSTWAGRQGSN